MRSSKAKNCVISSSNDVSMCVVNSSNNIDKTNDIIEGQKQGKKVIISNLTTSVPKYITSKDNTSARRYPLWDRKSKLTLMGLFPPQKNRNKGYRRYCG